MREKRKVDGYLKIKKEDLERSRYPRQMMVLLLGIVVGACSVGAIGSLVFFETKSLESEPLTSVLDHTGVTRTPIQLSETPLVIVEESQGVIEPTMTPYRPMGNDGSVFTVRFYAEEFVAETAASPNLSFFTQSPPVERYEQNGIAISHPEKNGVYVEAIPQNEIQLGLRSYETFKLDLEFDIPISALGLNFLSGPQTESTNIQCMDIVTQYDIVIKDGESELIQLSNHGSDFLGFASSTPFNRVEIRQATGGNSTCGSYLGSILTN